MTILGEPPTIIATHPAEPATPAARLPRQHSKPLHAVSSSARDQPVDTQAGDPDRTASGVDAVSRSADPESILDAWPLYRTDPVSVDEYRLVSRLGAGGMADVFYALAPTGRPVAVKLLRADGQATQACQREYRLASAVDTRCTAPVLGHGVSTAGAYLVTAYLPGYRSGTTLMGRRTPASRLWTLGLALARTLAAIHAKGIVHCDVKPSNLLVRDHDVRVIDFGIAQYVGERCGDDGIVQCSRGWAAPEQLRAGPATPAVDIFAWGCLLAHLASGVHPFASRSEQEWILRVQSAQPDLVDLPPDLDEVIRWTLARDPRGRPSARELATICRTRVDDAHPRPAPRPPREGAAAPQRPAPNAAALTTTVRLTQTGRDICLPSYG